jgi:ATP-dependent Clp protease ATP-binding subunit ClpC
MFDRFTDTARRVIVLAQEEARMLHHNYLGAEHLLIALARPDSGLPATALGALGVGQDTVRDQVEALARRGKRPLSGHIPFSPQAKQTLELSGREASGLGHHQIGPEHLLLALMTAGDGPALTILERLGTGPDQVREQVTALIAEDRDDRAAAPEQVAGSPSLTQARLQALEREVARLRRMLREHGIDPEDGSARSPEAGG